LAAEKSVRKDFAEADSQARLAADDLKSRISLSRPVQRIAVNPLLTTILCVVHRFLGRSIPEHRVTLYEKCTDALLYEWDRAKFPSGAAVGSLDAPQKRTLLRGVARILHQKHAAEVSEQEVIQHFARMLPGLGKSESDAQHIVQEIRDRSGMLVERRPGYFAFSHLTFQEYLAALDYVAGRSWRKLVDHSGDPWWHEVIALAAGAPGSDPTAIIRGLLNQKKRQSTFLAAQCAETAVDLLPTIRLSVEKAVDALLVPRLGLQSLVSSIGMMAAPLLMKRLLKEEKATSTAWFLYALQALDYEPAVPIIARFVADVRPCGQRYFMVSSRHFLTIGELATHILCIKAFEGSGVAQRAFYAALNGPLSSTFLQWFRKRALTHRYGTKSEEYATVVDDVLRRRGAGRVAAKSSKKSA